MSCVSCWDVYFEVIYFDMSSSPLVAACISCCGCALQYIGVRLDRLRPATAGFNVLSESRTWTAPCLHPHVHLLFPSIKASRERLALEGRESLTTVPQGLLDLPELLDLQGYLDFQELLGLQKLLVLQELLVAQELLGLQYH